MIICLGEKKVGINDMEAGMDLWDKRVNKRKKGRQPTRSEVISQSKQNLFIFNEMISRIVNNERPKQIIDMTTPTVF